MYSCPNECVYVLSYDDSTEIYKAVWLYRNNTTNGHISTTSFEELKAAFEVQLSVNLQADAVVLDYSKCVAAFPAAIHDNLSTWLRLILRPSTHVLIAPVQCAICLDLRRSRVMLDENQFVVLVYWRGKSNPLREYILLTKVNGVVKPLKVVDRQELYSIQFNCVVVSFDQIVSQRGLAKVQKIFPDKYITGITRATTEIETLTYARTLFFDGFFAEFSVDQHLGFAIIVKIGKKSIVVDKYFRHYIEPQHYVCLEEGVSSFQVFVKYLTHPDHLLYHTFKLPPSQKTRLLLLNIDSDIFLRPIVNFKIYNLTMTEPSLAALSEPFNKQKYYVARTMMTVNAPVIIRITDDSYNLYHHVIYGNVDSVIQSYNNNEEMIFDLMDKYTPNIVRLIVQDYDEFNTLSDINERRESLGLAGFDKVKLMHVNQIRWSLILRGLNVRGAVGDVICILGPKCTVLLKRCQTDFKVVEYFTFTDGASELQSSGTIKPDLVVFDNTHHGYDRYPHLKKKSFYMAHGDCLYDLGNLFWSIASNHTYDGFLIRDFANITFYVATEEAEENFTTNLIALPFTVEKSFEFGPVDTIFIRAKSNLCNVPDRFLVCQIKTNRPSDCTNFDTKITFKVRGPCDFTVDVSDTEFFYDDAYSGDESDVPSSNGNHDDTSGETSDQLTVSTINSNVNDSQKESPLRFTLPFFPPDFKFSSDLLVQPFKNAMHYFPVKGGEQVCDLDFILFFFDDNFVVIEPLIDGYTGLTMIPAYVSFKNGVVVGPKAYEDFETNRNYVVYDIHKFFIDDGFSPNPDWPFKVNIVAPSQILINVADKHVTDPIALMGFLIKSFVMYIKLNTAGEVKSVGIRLPKRSSILDHFLGFLNLQLGMKIVFY